MSEQNTTAPEPEKNSNGKHRRSRTKRVLFLVFIILASAFAGAFTTKLVAHKHHWRHSFLSTPIDPERVERRAEKMVNRIARRLDATSEQKDKLVIIAKGFAKDIVPLRQKMRSARQKSLTLLTQDKVDRNQIELFRAEQVTVIDDMTKRFAKAVSDMSEVLTLEQRQKIANRFLKRRGYRP